VGYTAWGDGVSARAVAALPIAQRRNLGILVATQALGAASPAIIVALGGLVGEQLASAPKLSTLPVSLSHLSLALSTLPMAWLMQRAGRRTAYLTGAVMGLLSGLIAAWGIVHADFMLFCIGTALSGFYTACVQNYRFAAADLAAESGQQARAISMIMIGGLIAAVIGPQVVYWTKDALVAAPFAGSFYSQAALALLAIPLLLSLRLPPTPPTPPAARCVQGDARPLMQIARTPQFMTAAAAGIVSYGLMTFLMTAAPLAMVHHGHSTDDAALGIQWHVLAMFAPSFITGRLITRFGKRSVTAGGLLMLAASALMGLSGLELVHFWGDLILLGVGWNFSFIGATALVTECYRPSERAKVQALNDFLMFSTMAAASFGSGHLLHSAGWFSINLGMLPIVVVVVGMLWLVRGKSGVGL